MLQIQVAHFCGVTTPQKLTERHAKIEKNTDDYIVIGWLVRDYCAIVRSLRTGLIVQKMEMRIPAANHRCSGDENRKECHSHLSTSFFPNTTSQMWNEQWLNDKDYVGFMSGNSREACLAKSKCLEMISFTLKFRFVFEFILHWDSFFICFRSCVVWRGSRKKG